ncbi:2-hydroxyacid dehydrogenase [Pseudohalioglobus lutimaris]|uniref:D-glycerate dehydrogenase n=1 Tax=Pseudohalioglobus lutimaris TaxID=1737061 RepID=A0A2N5X8C1_9GAMM|nr:D-glycerate dehydrogenase [Pseudohalioglobus lutimaris]PLW70732.1 D-glycerate dehydrogenase [Pseudohalioglobus lutimaris]
MPRPVIVVARQLPPLFMDAIASLGEVRVFDATAPAQSLEGASVWLGSAVDALTADRIASFPDSIGLIANIGVGTDNIDLNAAAKRRLQISNTPVVTEDTADLAMALLLATCRRLSASERLLREGDFAAGAGQQGIRVHGKTLGIVGFGAIGQAVARRASGFAMRVIYHGPRPRPEAEAVTGASFCEQLAQLLAEADIVSLHCPLTDATRHLFDAGTFAQMKAGAVLINTGRGALVDESALVDALAGNQLGGAGLDVFEFEPEVTPALKRFDNVTLLPHIGSATGECRADMAMRALANISAFLEQGRPLDGVTAA